MTPAMDAAETSDGLRRPGMTASEKATSDSTPSYRSPLAADANAGLVALITGGGTGIGRATALEFARTGARVTICGRREEPLRAVEAATTALGAECFARPTDVREPDQVERLVDETLERFGRIDALVHCAGGQFTAAAEDISTNGWRAVHRLTIEAAWNLTHTVARRSMIPNRSGVVVFVGFSPRRGIPGFAHASAARAALENLASGLALEWSRYGIRSLCVGAGTIRTEGLDQYGSERVDAWERQVPLGRLGTAEEVGALIAFLASPGASYLTGTTVVIDGGADAWGIAESPPPPEPFAQTVGTNETLAPRQTSGDTDAGTAHIFELAASTTQPSSSGRFTRSTEGSVRRLTAAKGRLRRCRLPTADGAP